MSDVFVSYASADRDRAKVVADALAANGWSVWWDRTIPPGKEFDQVIEEALDAASCVVVLWSRTSVGSSWVKTEAAEAMRRKVLVPALIDDVRIPLEFRRLQAADLSQWTGEGSHPEFEKFCRSIKENLQPSSPRPEPSPEPPPRRRVEPSPRPEHSKPRSGKRNLVLATVAGIVVVGAAAMVYTGYSDHVDRADLEARIRLEEARRQAEEKREAEEAAARESAKRRAEEDRRASQQGTSPATPARDRAQRPAEQRTSTTFTNTIAWRDHALRYTGTVNWSATHANMKVAVFDLGSGLRVGDFDIPGTVANLSPSNYVITANFQIPGDSVTPNPHVHTARLMLRVQDGFPQFIQNCPRPGECYPASGSADLAARQREIADQYNETAKRVIQSIGR